ncbi:sodium/glutamate symporter [Sphingobium sp. JS3065]|nr:sodium/glutamate symporter [Sphingobium sp. JS3065]
MGRDYKAAVTAGGMLGYMLGTTANAMAASYSNDVPHMTKL